MTEDNLSLQQSVPAIQPSISKQRKKRRWDQPDESLVACGVVLPGMLAMSTVGSPGVSPPGAFSSSCAPSTSLLKVANVSIQSPVVQQQAAAVVQKLNQSKIQEELIIAREIVINDADPAMRYKLTKRQTQEEIQKCTGAVVITRGKYRPPNAVPDGEKPLYLHISGGGHLKETAERILAVDRAAAMVEDMLKQAPHPLSTCVYLGFDADPSLNIAARIRGPNDQYINHIINETGALVVLRGRGSGYLGNTIGEGGQQPLHLLLSSNNQKSLEAAKVLAENLLDTISRECGANRVSSCKVYGAVPAPQQLLVGVQSPGTEMHEYLSTASSMASSAATSVPSIPALPVVAPVIPTTFSYGSLVQSGNALPPGLACANGLPYSPPPLTACTSYSGYAGVYPQATPLQQVSLALRQSGPVSSTVAPAISAARVLPKSSSESEMRPPSKRKFQESPAAFNGPASLQQESDLQDPHKCLSHMEKSKSETPPPLTLKSLLPPPAPRTNSSICSVDSLKRVQSPPPQPPPMINSSLSVSRGISKGINKDGTSISVNSSSPAVPDTLVKLMEYGDDDDDDDDDDEEEDTDESGNESLKKIVNENATSKPFWAV